jgi:hypothetical protein
VFSLKPAKRNRRFLLLPALITLCVTAGPAGTATAAAGDPVAVARVGNGFVTIDGAGAVVRRFAMTADFISLGGNVVAVSRRTGTGAAAAEEVLGLDARTGRQLFRVPDAFAPTVLHDGRKVAFLPDRFARRDKQGNSVWIRHADGSVQRVVQFSNGPGMPGVDNGMHGDGTVLSLSFDATGSHLAVTEGNDAGLFIYDIWGVDVQTGKARRLTTGQKSRFPSVSPDGLRLAYAHERKSCGGPGPGYRAGDLETVRMDGTVRVAVLPGDCARYYTDPLWVSPTQLTAARLTRRADGTYAADLVLVDVPDRRTSLLASGISYADASPHQRRAAFSKPAQTGFTLLDTSTRRTLDVREGAIPRLSGNARW